MEARDPVRAFLNSILESRMEIGRIKRKLAALEERATSVTSQLTGMPRGGSADRDAVLAALADAAGEYYRRLAEAERRELEVVNFIDSLPTSEHRIILRLRYVDRKGWSKVLAALNDAGLTITERHMFRLHGAALREARELYSQHYNKKENNDDEIRDPRGSEPNRER
jgi:hypothetical protein